MKVTTKPPEPVKPDILIELTREEASKLYVMLAAHLNRQLAVDIRNDLRVVFGGADQ